MVLRCIIGQHRNLCCVSSVDESFSSCLRAGLIGQGFKTCDHRVPMRGTLLPRPPIHEDHCEIADIGCRVVATNAVY